jgi:hypothetical protein
VSGPLLNTPIFEGVFDGDLAGFRRLSAIFKKRRLVEDQVSDPRADRP